MERGYIRIVHLPCRTGHEIVAEGQIMRFAQACNCIVLRLEHLGDHDLRQRVLVDAARSLMDEHIVVDLREARDAIVEGDGRVEAEQGQVEVPASHILTLQGVRLGGAALMGHLIIY